MLVHKPELWQEIQSSITYVDATQAFEKVNGIKIPYSIKPRRAGDIATCYSNPAKAERELGWKAQYGLEEMCRDAWNWQRNNPNGY